MLTQRIHLVGFGSQGTAWAQSLRENGWTVQVYVRPGGPSWAKAETQHFETKALSDLPGEVERDSLPLVAMLCVDDKIGQIYRDLLRSVSKPVTLVLAHGYAVYAGHLQELAPGHRVALLAPKAIGPRLRSGLVDAKAQGQRHHTLKAGLELPPEPDRQKPVLALAEGLGFAPENLIATQAATEAVGDLISEQGLLCGTVFTALEWTLEAMQEAGVPAALIREECLTELELIASLLREKGPASTFSAISAAAQCGTLAVRERLEAAGMREVLREQFREVTERRFPDRLERDPRWRAQAEGLLRRFAEWEKRLNTEEKKS